MLQGKSNVVRQSSDQADAETQQIIAEWLKRSGKNESDLQELRQLLQSRLESQFKVNQDLRREEINRLQELLDKSRQRLEQRDKERETIIQKQLEELLKQAS